MNSSRNLSLVVSAPSGAGKTTIIRKLISEDDRIGFSISTTTRKKRPDDIEGKSYYYISREEFKNVLIMMILLNGLRFMVIYMEQREKRLTE